MPDLEDCAGDDECITSATTVSGDVIFARHLSKLESGRRYVVCAALSTQPVGEGTAGVQRVHHVCGDGVVIDDDPPVQGTVSIANVNDGFLAGEGHVLVTWSDFTDVEAAMIVPAGDVTVNYSVALGKSGVGEVVCGVRMCMCATSLECVCVCVCVCVCARARARARAYVCVCMCARARAYVCVSMCLSVRARACARVRSRESALLFCCQPVE